MLSCVEALPSSPLEVDRDFVAKHCGSCPWVPAASCSPSLPSQLAASANCCGRGCWRC